MQNLKLTLKDKTKILIENAKEIRTSLNGNVTIYSLDGAKIVNIKDIEKYEIISKK